MKTTDFTSIPDRTNTGSLKWQKYADTDILPMWVADMDFTSSPEIMQALSARVEHGVFGYTVPYAEATRTATGYLRRMHGLDIEDEMLVWLPGLVQGLNLVCRACGGSGDGVMVNTPVYPPFLSAPIFSDRKRITVELVEKSEGRYTFDREAMQAAVTPDTKLFILCNPHNPVGRVFDREELNWLLDFCEEHDLWICSDEIHCDLILDEQVRHVPFLSLGERAAKRTIVFLSASKTYNLPGLACAYAVIPNPDIRKAFQKVCRGIVTEVNCFGYVGMSAAYTHGEAWRQEMLTVLRQNLALLERTLKEKLPRVKMPKIEATYLAWLDFRDYGLENPAAFFESHGVGLSNGTDFGAPSGFLRLNFGCPTSVLEEGLDRICTAMAE
ncbi:MAG: PatB family C-S lyase [Kiritimatiellae bacterium]|jgi:cystathionine beta-lyase|nr:PatB family C-S lyase [Kiritimatiellia bacterium]